MEGIILASGEKFLLYKFAFLFGKTFVLVQKVIKHFVLYKLDEVDKSNVPPILQLLVHKNAIILQFKWHK